MEVPHTRPHPVQTWQMKSKIRVIVRILIVLLVLDWTHQKSQQPVCVQPGSVEIHKCPQRDARCPTTHWTDVPFHNCHHCRFFLFLSRVIWNIRIYFLSQWRPSVVGQLNMLELLTHICWGSQTSSLPREERQTVAIMHVYISVAAYRSTSVWQPASFLSLPRSVGLYRSQKLTDTYAEPSTVIKSENENVWWLWVDDLQSCFTKVTVTATSLWLENHFQKSVFLWLPVAFKETYILQNGQRKQMWLCLCYNGFLNMQTYTRTQSFRLCMLHTVINFSLYTDEDNKISFLLN